VSGEGTPFREIQELLAGALAGAGPRHVLDAGCGYSVHLELPDAVELTGLDISPEVLEKHEGLDAKIVGDVETYPLPSATFDVVLCWNVLEHLPHPRAAVANLARTLKPGGLLIVGVPNLWSLKGLVTKLTPHRFHVWVYRRILGHDEAGTPEFGPYPTYLRRDISPARLAGLARTPSLDPVYARSYAVPLGLPRALGAAWSAVAGLGRVLTLGAWDSAATEHVAVFRKQGTAA